MGNKFLLFVLVAFFCAFHARASIYKLDHSAINLKFELASCVDLGFLATDEYLIPNTKVDRESVNQKYVVLLAVCCGTLGLHRFYMGHTKAGFIHLGGTLLTVLVGILGYNYIMNYSITNANVLNWAFYSIIGIGLYAIIWGVKLVYNVVEGIAYLRSDEERFYKKLVVDKRYFAAFSKY